MLVVRIAVMTFCLFLEGRPETEDVELDRKLDEILGAVRISGIFFEWPGAVRFCGDDRQKLLISHYAEKGVAGVAVVDRRIKSGDLGNFDIVVMINVLASIDHPDADKSLRRLLQDVKTGKRIIDPSKGPGTRAIINLIEDKLQERAVAASANAAKAVVGNQTNKQTERKKIP